MQPLKNTKILITGGAGFIGSNMVEYFLKRDNYVKCMDNLSTGHEKNLDAFKQNKNFQFINADIRNLNACRKAVEDCQIVFHQAALGSVPRSINDPMTSNAVNIDGFLNMLTAAKEFNIKRFIYAGSSSSYGDYDGLPKIEEMVGKPLSPYAITKTVNEYYARVYSLLYGMETIGLRYFNVFGKNQDPNSNYAAVIPAWIKKLISLERPIINGDGSYSRDFTYVGNVLQANEKAAIVPSNDIRKKSEEYYQTFDTDIIFKPNIPEGVMDVFNVGCGANLNLLDLFSYLKNFLSNFNPAIAKIEPIFNHVRKGDVAHSNASIKKSKTILGYIPKYSAKDGLRLSCEWYWEKMS